MRHTLRYFLVILSLLSLTGMLVGKVLAQEDFIISGNGEGSNNQLNIQSSKTTNVQQSSNTNIQNNASSNADTGGNTVGSGGQIITGNATSKVVINNDVNGNAAKVDSCCGKTNPPTPPTPPPPPPPGGGGGHDGGGGGGGGSSSGGGGGSSGSSTAGSSSPAVLGLSATDGPMSEQYIFYALGLACLSLGGKLLLSKFA